MELEIIEATERLKVALPYLRNASNRTKKVGKVELGILATQPDGSGNVTVRMEADSFFDDLALVLGVGPQTEEDDAKARALEFRDRFGL